MARTLICAQAKDPVSVCCKRVGLTAGGMVTEKYCIFSVKPPQWQQNNNNSATNMFLEIWSERTLLYKWTLTLTQDRMSLFVSVLCGGVAQLVEHPMDSMI